MSCEVIKGLVNDGFTLVLFLHLKNLMVTMRTGWLLDSVCVISSDRILVYLGQIVLSVGFLC